MTVKKIMFQVKKTPPVVVLLLIGVILFSITAKNFLTYRNFINVLIQASPLLILATGQTLAILVGGIDLSLGYVMSFCGLTAAYSVNAGFPLILVIIISIVLGASIGTLNGFFIARCKVPYFISTYGIGNVFFGIGLLLTGGVSIPALNSNFRYMADGKILGFPVIIIISVSVFFCVLFIINKTFLGRNMYALGGNREALFLSGVNIIRAETFVFTCVGALAGCAGLLLSARAASGHPATGMGWEFDTVAATIIGGNSFKEGKGNLKLTLLGVLFIQMLRNGLNISGVAPQVQSFLVGVIVVLAISIDVLSKKKKEL